VARLALIVAEPGKDARRWLLAGSKGHGIWEVSEVPLSGCNVTRCAQAIKRALFRQRSQHRHRATPVSDFEALPILNTTEQLAGPLAKFTNTDPCHVLLVAHLQSGAQSLRCDVIGGASEPNDVMAAVEGCHRTCHQRRRI